MNGTDRNREPGGGIYPGIPTAPGQTCPARFAGA